MAQNARRIHKIHCFWVFSTKFTPQKVHRRGLSEVDLSNNVLYGSGAPFRRALGPFERLKMFASIFQSTHSVRSATRTFCFFVSVKKFQSTHSVWSATPQSTRQAWRTLFQSTHSVWSATSKCRWMAYISGFQSTHSVWRATVYLRGITKTPNKPHSSL